MYSCTQCLALAGCNVAMGAPSAHDVGVGLASAVGPHGVVDVSEAFNGRETAALRPTATRAVWCCLRSGTGHLPCRMHNLHHPHDTERLYKYDRPMPCFSI